MEPMNVESSSGSWRTRDACSQSLLDRGVDTGEMVMHLSASFDVDTALARLRRDKASVVRDAFGAAAQTVLVAARNQANHVEDKQDAATATDNIASLPPVVEQWQELQNTRATSMTKVSEYKKKMTGSTKASARSSSPKTFPSLTRTKPTALMPTSAASSDARITVSRAVLCTAASIVFDQLTPAFEGHDLDVVDVPQNNKKNTSAEGTQQPTVNMGAVLLQAQTLGQRTAALAETSTRRSRQRYEYLRDNARYAKSPRSVLQVTNPFALKQPRFSADQDDSMEEDVISYPPRPFSKGAGVTEEWKSLCLPRFKAVLNKGSGHAVYCDVEWPTRHGRIADLLKELSDNSLGPHLIVTTRPEVEAFAQEFESVDSHVRLVPRTENDGLLRVLTYKGSKSQRRKLRRHFENANGLPDSSFHVLVVSYTDFLQDYLHLCQLPYEAVVLDDGWSWLAAAHIDNNSSIGKLWEEGMFSTSDQHTGLAGTMQMEKWDFADDDLSKEQVKKACTGLTARHRILMSPSVYAGSRESRHQGPVPSLIKFLLPHFPDVVGEEWDRSRIETDAPSMEHMRKLACRSIIVYHPTSEQKDLYKLAQDAMGGLLPSGDRSQDATVPHVIQDHTFVADGKFSQSRRAALACFGLETKSWLRYELGMASLQGIQDTIRRSGAHGYVCEEVVPASSLTSSGANGTVSGMMAYRLAVRCGRSFGSEVGLRQHMAAMHAPPGTWLCRTCGVDCGTAPSRTAHERACGQPPAGPPGESSNPVGENSSAGKRPGGPVSVVGKKAKKKSKSPAGQTKPEDKDADGSFRVPGYRGVWVNPEGKHFVKIGTERLREGNEDAGERGDIRFFDSIDDAAKKHDDIVRERGLEKTDGLNFNEDGSRIVHEDDTAPSAASGSVMGGGASSVVPALSVINIKDLPKDVTPLLRDPRQTSRTGGNSKRHVYAYRGVCRQARKGHDRWQSQISFSGTNHYLGTFDSEWDAAAIYAWAHLILYGEEATAKARLEGEEAAAAYEQEKKDIAAGKVIAPPPKPPKKKRKKKTTASKDGSQAAGGDEGDADGTEGASKTPKGRKKRAAKEARSSPKVCSMPEIAPILDKAASSLQILAPRKAFETMSDSEMIQAATARIKTAQFNRSSGPEANRPFPIPPNLRPCAPMSSVLATTPAGGAMLMGLSPLLFGWNMDVFLSKQFFETAQMAEGAVVALRNEYGINRYNDSFRTVMQGTVCTIGRATERMERAWDALRLPSPIPLGATVGDLDCNIAGITGSCSESAATIVFCPSAGANFQIRANNDVDVVTLNGQRILSSSGSFPLFNEDVCTVGARVFVFLLPVNT